MNVIMTVGDDDKLHTQVSDPVEISMKNRNGGGIARAFLIFVVTDHKVATLFRPCRIM